MHQLHTVFGWFEMAIDVSAALIMVLAFAVAVFSYFKIVIGSKKFGQLRLMQELRCELGVKLVFALELLIISDLLHTIVSRSIDDMIIVGALVLIRTAISYFLNKEIEQIHAEFKHPGESDRD